MAHHDLAADPGPAGYQPLFTRLLVRLRPAGSPSDRRQAAQPTTGLSEQDCSVLLGYSDRPPPRRSGGGRKE
jgi:hypothetical protein